LITYIINSALFEFDHHQLQIGMLLETGVMVHRCK